MKFEIQERIDLSGTMTTVRIPEGSLDKSALYTLQADMPDFIVPFRYRFIDGYVEFTYEVERYTKLQYFFNRKTAAEYVEFWEQLLQPLLDCSDWFLNPFSFVLNSRYIYVDKSGKRISYLYIPAQEQRAEFKELKDFVVDIYYKNPVMDQSIENKVLKAIMQDFQPRVFLQMLRDTRRVTSEYRVAEEPKRNVVMPEIKRCEKEVAAPVATPIAAAVPEPDVKPVDEPIVSAVEIQAFDDIVINIPDGKSAKKEKGEVRKKDKKEKKEKSWGLFGKKESKPESRELRFGAAENRMDDLQIDIPISAHEKVAAVRRAPVVQPSAVSNGITTENFGEETRLDEEYGITRLRLAGDVTLPKEIRVEIQPNQIFSVGRYDVTVGHKQSSFEFERNTKAVSRHHAAIERQEDGTYTIVDLSSSAGTFVQGQRLTPNVPQMLRTGYRVSFGTSGADYIWEET